MYINRYTGMGAYVCINIVQPPVKKMRGILEITDCIGRDWLCCELGKPATEPIAIAIIYDFYPCHFAKAMGDPINGGPLDRSTEEQEKWASWYKQIIEVDTPSIEELPTRLATISININGHRIYPDLPLPNSERQTQKIGSSALDPEPIESPASEDEQYATPSFLNTFRTFSKRK